MAITPTRQLLEQRGRVTAMTEELSQIERANRALRAGVDRLNDPDYIEEQARAQFGLVRPGETAYLVIPKPRKSSRHKGKVAEARRPTTRGGFIDRALHFVGLE